MCMPLGASKDCSFGFMAELSKRLLVYSLGLLVPGFATSVLADPALQVCNGLLAVSGF